MRLSTVSARRDTAGDFLTVYLGAEAFRRKAREAHIAMRPQIPHSRRMDDDSLIAANAAYYRAFAARDLAAMEAIWAQEGVTCVHPGWPALIGRAPVIASYRDIFRNPSQEAVTAREERVLIAGFDGRVFCVEEVGGSLLLATNWFRSIDGAWRLLHHQASPLVAPSAAQSRGPKPSFH